MPKLFLHFAENIFKSSTHMENVKHASSHTMPILTSALSRIVFEVLNTFDAFGMIMDAGKLAK